MPGTGHRGQLHTSALESLGRLHRGLGRLQVAEHLAGGFDELGTGVGEDDAAPDAVEQRDPDFAFEGAYRLGQRWLRDVQSNT